MSEAKRVVVQEGWLHEEKIDAREFFAGPGDDGFWLQLKNAQAIGIDVLAGQRPVVDSAADRLLRRCACAILWLCRVAAQQARVPAGEDRGGNE